MKTRPSNVPGDAGFTLIEVIVALAILSAGLLVFYQFLSTALHAAGRIQAGAEAYDRDENALAIASSLNPMVTPEGSLSVGSYTIHWHAERITPPTRNELPNGGPGSFIVALYRIVLDFADDRDFGPVEVTKLGYHRETVPGPPAGEPSN